MPGLMVRKVIVPAQDHADFPYLVPDGIPARQREHGTVHVGGIVQGEYLLGYRVQGDERFFRLMRMNRRPSAVVPIWHGWSCLMSA